MKRNSGTECTETDLRLFEKRTAMPEEQRLPQAGCASIRATREARRKEEASGPNPGIASGRRREIRE